MSWEEKSQCPWARSAHGPEPLSSVLGASLVAAAVALALVFRDDYAIPHLCFF